MTFTVVGSVILIGLLVGVASNVFGLGGGILITPLLPLVIQISQHDLVATSLTCIALVVMTNVISFHRQKRIVWKVARVYGWAASGGAFLAAFVSIYIPEQGLRILTFVVMVTLTLVLLKKPKPGVVASPTPLRYWPLGTFAGMAQGLTGIGTGIILTPFFLAKKIVPHDQVSPTSNAILIFATVTAVLSYILRALEQGRSVTDAIYVECVLLIVGSALVISRYARRYQNSLPERQRRMYMATIMFGLSLLVLKSILDKM